MSTLNPDDADRFMANLSLMSLPECSPQDKLLLTLINDDATDLAQLAELVEASDELTVLVVGLAGSGFFHRPDTDPSVPGALGLFGLELSRNICLGAILRRASGEQQGRHFSLVDYLADALTTACLCQLLVDRHPVDSPVSSAAAYLCGYLAQFGQLVLIHCYPREIQGILQASEGDIDRFIHAQEARLGINQSELGGLLGRHWDLPAEVVLSMQHSFDDHYTGDHWQLARLVTITARMVAGVRLGEPLPRRWPAQLDAIMTRRPTRALLARLPRLRMEMHQLASHLTGLRT